MQVIVDNVPDNNFYISKYLFANEKKIYDETKYITEIYKLRKLSLLND